MNSGKMLIVDDDDRLRERLGKAMSQRGFDVLLAASHSEAMSLASAAVVDLAVVDLRMPEKNGLLVVRDLLKLHPRCQIVVVTGYGSIATAIDAIRLGARDYLIKPCHADRILAAFEAEPEAETEDVSFEIPTLARVEREHIERVLQECSGNISKAARALGMHRRTLQYKLAKFPVSR